MTEMVEPREQKEKKKRPAGATTAKKRKQRYAWLNVLPDDLWIKVRQGETVWEALQREDIDVGGDCGGLGKCGKCRIRVLSSIGPPTREELEHLDEEELRQGVRLACRTEVDKDLVINIGDIAAEEEYFQILKTGTRPLFELDPLVDQRFVTVFASTHETGLSDLDRIKLVLGPEFKDMKATLHCLRTLPQVLMETRFHGAAVLHDKCLMAWQSWEKVGQRYGLVFDLGTSTLVGKLVNLMDGTEEAVASCLNSQIRYGTNVISRLQYVKEHARGLFTMSNLMVNDLNRLIRHLVALGGLETDDIFIAVAAGNTTMQHLLLKLPPMGIAEAPFSPVLTDGLVVKAADVGLQLNPEAMLYMMPMRSGYIGGDLISVLIASGVSEQDDEIVLGLDLGTNGEIFLGSRSRLMTCSAAAGPALEGARISEGMIAKAGAIEGVSVEDGDIKYRVIGNVSPRGICGSGLVEMVAVLLELDIIDPQGLIRPPTGDANQGLASRLIERDGVYDFLMASAEESYDGRPLYLTQRDIRELQLAKGAIAAGIKTLMDEMGIGVEDIERIYLAGALGNYVSPESAMRIGLIPRLNLDVVTSLGNAASTGAAMVVLSKEYWRMANELSHTVEHIELSSRLDFNEYFVEQLDFPPAMNGATDGQQAPVEQGAP